MRGRYFDIVDDKNKFVKGIARQKGHVLKFLLVWWPKIERLFSSILSTYQTWHPGIFSFGIVDGVKTNLSKILTLRKNFAGLFCEMGTPLGKVGEWGRGGIILWRGQEPIRYKLNWATLVGIRLPRFRNKLITLLTVNLAICHLEGTGENPRTLPTPPPRVTQLRP